MNRSGIVTAVVFLQIVITGCNSNTTLESDETAKSTSTSQETPEQVFVRIQTSVADDDWGEFYDLLTAASKERLVRSIVSFTDSHRRFSRGYVGWIGSGYAKYGVAGTDKLVVAIGGTVEPSEEQLKNALKEHEKAMDTIISGISDKRGFAVEFLGMIHQLLKFAERPDYSQSVTRYDFRKVEMNGDAATVAAYPKEDASALRRHEFVLKREDGSWCFDLDWK